MGEAPMSADGRKTILAGRQAAPPTWDNGMNYLDQGRSRTNLTVRILIAGASILANPG
jgi:hypothetical protein